MTYTKMVDRLHEIASVQSFPTDDLVDAADAIEALQEKNALLEGTLESRERNITELQAENERLKREKQIEKENAREWWEQADALAAKLDALQTQGPIYAFRRKGLDDFCTCSEERYLELSDKPNLFEVKKFYAAPKASTHEQVEEAWRAGWAACRDAEYVGQEAEDEAWGMSQTCANADWENAAPKALEPLTDEQAHKAIREWCGDLNDDDEPSELDIVRATEAAHGITKGTP